MHFDKKSARNLFFVLSGAILLYLCLKHITPLTATLSHFLGYFSPFITGLCIAFIMNIPMSFLERNLLRLMPRQEKKRVWVRPVCIVLTLLLFIGVIAMVMFIVIPEISATVQTLPQHLSSYLRRLDGWINSLSTEMPLIVEQVEELGVDLASLSKRFFELLQSVSMRLVNSSFSAVGGVFKGAVDFFLGLVFAFYVLSSKEKLAQQLQRLLKAYAPDKLCARVTEVFSISHKTFSSFFTGQFVEALILGGLFFVGMIIFRFPYATLVSVLIAFTALIPIFGAFIGCAVGTFLILMISPVKALWFLVFFIVLQQLEGNLIYPRVVGSSIGLPAIWVLVAVTLGGSMFGVLGMLLFIPLLSVIYTLLRRAVRSRLGEEIPVEAEPVLQQVKKPTVKKKKGK